MELADEYRRLFNADPQGFGLSCQDIGVRELAGTPIREVLEMLEGNKKQTTESGAEIAPLLIGAMVDATIQKEREQRKQAPQD